MALYGHLSIYCRQFQQPLKLKFCYTFVPVEALSSDIGVLHKFNLQIIIVIITIIKKLVVPKFFFNVLFPKEKKQQYFRAGW